MASVTTRRGDDGTTGVIGPRRIRKDHPRIELLGALDEAVSALGLARSLTGDPEVRDVVETVQRDLYRLMAMVSTVRGEPPARIVPADVARLEELQDRLRKAVAIAPSFVVPGATTAGAAVDLARAIVRRAERRATTLIARLDGETAILPYLNRCSDLLFVLARYDEARQGIEPPRQVRSSADRT